MNQILQQINQFLREKEGTEKTYLLDNADSLFTVPDQFPRKTSKIAIKTDLINHSFFQKSLDPDTDFCLIDKNRLITARPFKRSNQLYLMTDANDVCSSTLILGQSKNWYANMQASADGQFLSFTDAMLPMLLKIGASEAVPIFNDSGIMLLNLQWSPVKPVMAGLVLNNQTQERQFFIFDAEKHQQIDLDNQSEIPANYLNPHFHWSPDGNKAILTSAKSVHLVDFAARRFYPDIIRLPNEISELIWSDNSSSFALVEIIGQARNRYIFDDLDYRKSILHRYNINADFTVPMITRSASESDIQ